MGLTIRLRILNNVKHSNTINLKFEDRLFSLNMLGLESKASINSIIRENLHLHCRKFSAFVVPVNLTYFNNKGSHKETPLVIVNFAIQSLVFQNSLLNVAHFISDIKVP